MISQALKTLIFCSLFGLYACQSMTTKDAETSLQQQVTELEQKIREDIDAFRLTSPVEENAIARIDQLATLAPDNPVVETLRTEVAERYIMLVEQTLVAEKLDKAKHYLAKAKSIRPSLEKLDQLEAAITAKEKQVTAAAERAAEEAKAAAAAAKQAAKSIPKAVTPKTDDIANTAKPTQQNQNEIKQTVAVDNKAQLAAIAKPTKGPTLVPLNQKAINARSTLVGLALDNVSSEIVDRNATVVIKAKSMRDYRWLSALLKTSVYLKDSNFNLRAEPFIDSAIEPSLEINPDPSL